LHPFFGQGQRVKVPESRPIGYGSQGFACHPKTRRALLFFLRELLTFGRFGRVFVAGNEAAYSAAISIQNDVNGQFSMDLLCLEGTGVKKDLATRSKGDAESGKPFTPRIRLQ